MISKCFFIESLLNDKHCHSYPMLSKHFYIELFQLLMNSFNAERNSSGKMVFSLFQLIISIFCTTKAFLEEKYQIGNILTEHCRDKKKKKITGKRNTLLL